MTNGLDDSSTSPLLEINDLRTAFRTPQGLAWPVDTVGFAIDRQETFGLVGESGCGKSLTALSILNLTPQPNSWIDGGSIRLRGQELVGRSERAMCRIRGADVAMIFQEPMTSLNPVYTAGAQIAEVFRLHRSMNRREAWEAAVEVMDHVRIPNPRARAREYPHQMSGGMRQRIMIAMALACRPALLIADEPTTALDVTIQAQILELMSQLRDEFHTAILIISHDMGVIAEVADHVAVMYAGQIVERADVWTLFKNPTHPYTQALLASIPKLDRAELGRRIAPIGGAPPDPRAYPTGCRFAPRCPQATAACRIADNALKEITPGHVVRCRLVAGSE